MRNIGNMKAGYIILFIIIGLGFFLRAYHLFDRELTHSDEGYYLVRTQQLKAKPLFSLPGCSAKPGHISLISLMSLLTGLEDYTSLIVSALFGILTVFLIYIMGKEIYGIETGLWAAFLIAISPYHLYYSRSGYSFAGALFFYILGIYFYYLSRVRRTQNLPRPFPLRRNAPAERKGRGLLTLSIAGISTGFAITCHHSFFWLWLALPAYELFLAKGKAILKRLPVLVFSLFLPAIVFESLVRITNFINPGKANDGFAYFPQLRRLFAQFIPFVARFDSARDSNFAFLNISASAVASYLRFFWRLEGPLVCILFIAGSIIILNRLRKKPVLNDFIILTQALIPLFIWFSHAYLSNKIRVKALFVILPAMAIISGRGIVELREFIKKIFPSGFAFRLFSTILIASLILCPVTKGIKEIISIKNSFKTAAFELIGYLKDSSPPVGVSFSSHRIWQFYFTRYNIDNLYVYEDGAPLREGLFIIDYGTRKTFDQEVVWRSQKITIRELMAVLEGISPIINLPYLRDDILPRALKPDFGYDKSIEYLRVYDLRRLNEAKTYGTK
jgi:4-amino-4-deoxy-L-arabinose transferase-like glycosyltransferase